MATFSLIKTSKLLQKKLLPIYTCCLLLGWVFGMRGGIEKVTHVWLCFLKLYLFLKRLLVKILANTKINANNVQIAFSLGSALKLMQKILIITL